MKNESKNNAEEYLSTRIVGTFVLSPLLEALGKACGGPGNQARACPGLDGHGS